MKNWKFVTVYGDDGTSKSKRPIGKDWQHNLKTLTEVSKHKGNVGLKLGDDSNGVLSFDFDGSFLYEFVIEMIEEDLEFFEDDIEIHKILKKFITSTSFQTSPNHHQILINVTKKGITKEKIHCTKIKQFCDEGGEIEILANGQQTVIPPSTCSKEGKYESFKREWKIKPSEIQTLTFEEFEMLMSWLRDRLEEPNTVKTSIDLPDSIYEASNATIDDIVNTINLSNGFREGQRHDFTKGLCCLMIENGIEKETTQLIVKKLIIENGGDVDDLLKVVEYYYTKRYSRAKMIKELELMMS